MKLKLQITSERVSVEADEVLPFDDSPTAWMQRGNCRNYPPATFFPSDGVGVDRARAICKGCPVTGECLEYALSERIEHGVWGGCSERERRRILKRRKGLPV
ncbi:MAG: WhiB family transcriptional regulator [Ilumatobacteraceae bacterium]